MMVRGHDFANIYDLVGVRIIVDTIQDCYAALGAIVAVEPGTEPFKDYIAMPKLNMYQSLHTTVVGPGEPVEVQVALGTCTAAPNSASPRTGNTRKTARPARALVAGRVRSKA